MASTTGLSIKTAVLALVVLALAGCGNGQPKNNAPDMATESKVVKLQERPETAEPGPNYRLISEEKESQVFMIMNSKHHENGYIVKIFDENKKVINEIKIPKVANYEPWTKMVDDDIVQIRQGRGSGFWVCNYFDRKNNRLSKLYHNPLLAGHGKVIFPTGDRNKTNKIFTGVAVSDIFDQNAFYKEFPIDDLQPSFSAFKEVRWIGVDRFSVTYETEEKIDGKFQTKTVVFDLTMGEREKRLEIISQEREITLFKITDAKEGEVGFVVRVFDDEKKVVYEELILNKGRYLPQVKLVNDGLIKIRQYGKENVWLSRYYDRTRNRISPHYANLLTSGYGKVVFSEPGKVIVTDTFDKNALYKEFAIDDLAAPTEPADAILETIWSGPDGLEVTYAVKSGEVFAAKTVFMDLISSANKAREIERIDDSWRLVRQAKEYRIYTGFDRAIGLASYVVMVYDDRGNVVHVTTYPVSRIEPSVTMLDDNIVEMTFAVGTGTRYTHYYDRENRRKSPVYYSPRLVGYGKVVAPKIGKLVVADMFGEGLYYRELIIADFPRVANPVDAFNEIKWAGENKLSVTYWVGDRNEKASEKTLLFDLNE